MARGEIASARLVIDYGAKAKNADIIARWRGIFGPRSVRYTVTHAKIATVAGAGLRFRCSGSMNLNHNPRFEQFELAEGGPCFDLVRRLEDELPAFGDDAPGADIFAAARVGEAFDAASLEPFRRLHQVRPGKRWAK